jgi:hypothetical protein
MTATDISALLYPNDYRSPLRVYLDKKGAEPFAGNRFTRAGRLLEPVVLQMFGEDHQCLDRMRTPAVAWPESVKGTLRHPKRHLALATPDSAVVHARGRGIERIVEAKTASAWSAGDWGESGTEEVPLGYRMQVLWGMFVTGIHEAHLAALVGGNDFRSYVVRWDPALVEGLVEIAEAFWKDHVLADIPPPASWSAWDDEHFSSLHPRNELPMIESTPEIDAIASELCAARVLGKHAEQREAVAKTTLKSLIGDHEGVAGAWGKITWRTNKNGVPSWAKIGAELLASQKPLTQELIDQHTGEPARVFKPTFEKAFEKAVVA